MKGRRNPGHHLVQFLHCTKEEPLTWEVGESVRRVRTAAAEGWIRGWPASAVSPKLDALVDDSSKALYIQ